jgi:hypothetical protein
MTPMTPGALAGVRKRVDHLLSVYAVPVRGIVATLTPEGHYVAALFDASDADGMQVHREVGLDSSSGSATAYVVDVLEEPLQLVFRKHGYDAIDDLGGYAAGSVVLYVFTMGAVVARRFKFPVGAKLREVRLARDVEFRMTQAFEGRAAMEVIVQRSREALVELWDGGTDRVAFIQSASHGAKVGYIPREVAIGTLRTDAARAGGDDEKVYRGMVEALSDGSTDNLPCIFRGWGTQELIWFEPSSLARSPSQRPFDDSDVDHLQELVVACRDPKRALGLFKKSLESLAASPVAPSLRELVALVRDDWQNCQAILAKMAVVENAALPVALTEPGMRLRGALAALSQATLERERGGAVNGRGGRA